MTPTKRKTDAEGSMEHMKRSLDYDQHDDVCDRRLGWIKTAIYCLVITVFLSGAYGWTKNEGMQAKNDTQDQIIHENTKDINEMKGILNEHIKDQAVTNKEMLKILGEMKTDIAVIKRNSE